MPRTLQRGFMETRPFHVFDDNPNFLLFYLPDSQIDFAYFDALSSGHDFYLPPVSLAEAPPKNVTHENICPLAGRKLVT
ncbi:MAG: hypothetical protein U1F68_20450 [Gammaproteobacteria bacterium]